MINTVENILHEKDCRCAKCKKLLFRIELNTIHVNIQLDELRVRKLSIKCGRCDKVNVFDMLNLHKT